MRKRLRVLFLCTHNSARSQIANALLSRKGRERFIVASAGTEPASRVHTHAIEALARAGIDWHDRVPQGIDAVTKSEWDLVITLCDRARERCPRLSGQPVLAHWSIPDPAAVSGEENVRRDAFWDVLVLLSRRLDLLVALPDDKIEALAEDAAVLRDLGLESSEPAKAET